MQPTQQAARDMALASSGATLIAFIGFLHEVAGHIIFPWGPDFLGGPIGWHGLGLFAIAVGLLLLGGTLGLIRFPVVPVATGVAGLALVIAALTALLYDEFHVFALVGSGAGVLTAICHRRAHAQRSGTPA